MDKAEDASQDNPSMEEILQTIRGVISGEVSDSEEAEDILELTEVAEEPAPSVSKKTEDASEDTPIEAQEDVAESVMDEGDILDSIDKALAKDEPAEEESAEDILEAAPEPELAVEEAAVEEVEPVAEVTPEPEPEPILDPIVEDVEPEPEPVVEEVMPEPVVAKEVIPEPEEPVVAKEVVSEPKAEPVADKQRLISEQAAAQSMKALQELVETVPKTGPALRSGVTIEDLVVEALRPQLSEWLDKNLASLVERLVEKEIRKLLPEDRN